jgi:hypothetical protein
MNLIYYTVSGDKKYLSLLELSIESLIIFGKYREDILLICDKFIKDNITIDYPNLKYMIVEEVDKNLSSGNKLRVYEYEFLSKYNNILFLDSDILVINDINPLFEESSLEKDKFIVSSEIGLSHNNRVITNSGHAGELLTENQKILYKNIPCINAGCFLFRNNKENLETLKETYNLYINGKRLDLYEQPYLNYVLLIRNKFIHNLQNYISHISLIDRNKSIIHYCGPVGNFEFKFKFMKRDLDILKGYVSLILYDLDDLDIWIESDSIFIKSIINSNNSKVIIYDDDLLIYKELIDFSKGSKFWFKPGKKLKEFNNCIVKVFDKYDNLIKESKLITNYNFKTSYNKDENKIYISCEKKLDADVFILRVDSSVIYKTKSFFNNNQFWYKPDTNLYDISNIKIQIKDNKNHLIFEEVMLFNSNSI